MNRTYILARNIFYNSASQLWFLILTFITTPYIVHKLGSDVYGILSLVGVVLGYFTFLNLGLGPAVIKYISEYYAKKDYQGIQKVIGSALIFYLLIGFIGAFLIASLTGILVNKLLRIPEHLIKVSSFAFYIAALGFLVNMPVNVFGAIPKALQRFDIANKINIIIGTFSIGLTVFLLYLDFHLKEIVILNLVISIIYLVIYIIVSKKLLPEIQLMLCFDYSIFLKLCGFGSSIVITQIAAQIAYHSDKFLIGFFLPITYLAYYTISFNFAQKLLIIPGIISSVSFPAVSELSSLKLNESVKELYASSLKFVSLISLSLAAVSVVFAEKFLLFWIGPEFAKHGTLPLQILIGVFFLAGLTSIPSTVSQGLGRPDISAKFSIITAVLNTLLLCLFIPLLKITGASLAFFITHIILVPIYFAVVNRIIGISSRELIQKTLIKSTLAGILLFIVSLIISPLVLNLSTLLLFGALVYSGFLLLAYFLILDQKDRDSIKHLITNWAEMRKF